MTTGAEDSPVTAGWLRRFDAFEAVRLRAYQEGVLPLAAMTRLLDGLPAQEGEVSWSVQGREGALGEPLLALQVQAEVQATCQRCMAPFALPLEAEALLHLVRTEEELGAPDAPPDEDEIEDEADKVLAARGLDLFEQIQDELILAMPYIPRHAQCPDAPVVSEAGPARPSPFAVLGELKGRVRRD